MGEEICIFKNHFKNRLLHCIMFKESSQHLSEEFLTWIQAEKLQQRPARKWRVGWGSGKVLSVAAPWQGSWLFKMNVLRKPTIKGRGEMRKAESRGFASLGWKLSSLPAEAGLVGQGPAAPFWALLPGTAPCWAARVPPDRSLISD